MAVRFVGFHWMLGDYTVEVNADQVHPLRCGGAADRLPDMAVREGESVGPDAETVAPGPEQAGRFAIAVGQAVGVPQATLLGDASV